MNSDRIPRPQSSESRSATGDTAAELEVDRVYLSLSSEDGFTEQRVAEDSRGVSCGHCTACNENCCNGSDCQQSKVGKNAAQKPENIEEAKPCCSEKKKKSILFRKSTNLFLSGLIMLGVTGISVADIATDVLTSREYYLSGHTTAFVLSLVFLVFPPILLTAGIIRRRDDSVRNTTAKTMPCCVKFLIVILNVPLKLYMIWLQLVYSFRCFKKFHKWRKSRCLTQEETLLEGSLSHFITELTLYKLWNSIFESMPQLLLTVHVIMTEPFVLQSSHSYLLIVSSVFSFGSLCVGIIIYAIKAKQAESQPKNERRAAQQPLRAKSMVLGIPQIILISIYTVCFLGSRALSLSYFIVFFKWYVVIVPGVHWVVVFVFFSHRRYINQKNTMHHYRMTTYQRRSSSFVYVFVHSVMSVFIHIKPECEEVLDQPRYYKFFYYFFYAIENCLMILMPLMVREIPSYFMTESNVTISDELLASYKYYPVTYSVLASLAIGCFACALYHMLVHKSARFTREQVFGPCCKCCYGPGGFLCLSCLCCPCCREKDDEKVFIACKNISTHEICKVSLGDVKRWKESTESKLLNKKPLRSWKVLHNAHKGSKRSDEAGAGSRNNPPTASVENPDQTDAQCPYTMRRSGLHILSDPYGNLFYAPITDVKTRTIPI